MPNAKRDYNRVTVLMGALDTDGKTPTPIYANPSTNVLATSDATTGSDNGELPIVKDGNRVPILAATSSADGVSIVELYADSSNNLLIDSS